MGRLSFKKILKEFGKIISLNSKYRPYVFIIVLLILTILPISILEKTPQFSICQKALGDYCPSTGITRGVASLLKGDFDIAWNHNPLSLLVLIVMVVIILIDFYKRSRTARIK